MTKQMAGVINKVTQVTNRSVAAGPVQEAIFAEGKLAAGPSQPIVIVSEEEANQRGIISGPTILIKESTGKIMGGPAIPIIIREA